MSELANVIALLIFAALCFVAGWKLRGDLRP